MHENPVTNSNSVVGSSDARPLLMHTETSWVG
ncbi:uncharacterized protein METZ01_LOCUS296625 [marine metagenome]|uniref:Uncharacterized protein n=1 Tax=marine metagenome TaxID=408172 RepID=A0A382M986_9ZZZZ